MTRTGSLGSPTAHIDTFIRDHLISAPETAADRVNGAVELLDAMVGAGYADRPALYWGDEKWTYVELMERANRLARVLVEDGDMVPGERVLLPSGDHPVMVTAWFAVLKAGGIAIHTPPTTGESELAQLMEAARVQFVVCHCELEHGLKAAALKSDHLRYLLFFGDGAPDGLDARMASKAPTIDNVDTAANDPAIIISPGARVHFHGDIVAATANFLREVTNIGTHDVVCIRPGFTFLQAVCPVLGSGAAVVLVEDAMPLHLLVATARFRASICLSTPSGYQEMLGHLERYDTSSLRACVVMGGPPPSPLSMAWQEKTGLRLISGPGPGAAAGTPIRLD